MESGVARMNPAHVIPKVNLCMHTIPCFFCRSKGLFGQSTIFGFYWPDMNTEMGVVIYMYLNILQIILIPNIYGFWSNSLGSSILADIPFLAFLILHRERKRCGQVGPSPCYSQSEVV